MTTTTFTSIPTNGQPLPITPRLSNPHHTVFFYEEDDFLSETVARFLGAGLVAHEPVVVLATSEHRAAFQRKLEAEGHDVSASIRAGAFIMLDAHETLARVMVDGAPDPQRFNDVIASLLERLIETHGRRNLRLYGEMVNVLCSDGRPDAAVALERLWNDLSTRYRFSLLCAYVMDDVAKDLTIFEDVCGEHAQALGMDRATAPHARLRAIAELQRRTRSLEAEIERSRSSESFQLLVESVQDYAIFMLDNRGFIKTWNAGAERLKGYKAREIIGQHFSRFYPNTDVVAGKCEHELEVASQEGRFEDEGWRVRKDGTLFWANVIITALRAADGELIGFAKVTRDLTDRRNAEEERVRLAQESEANRVKDEFLATISHELRTPLNAILGWGRLLAERQNDAYTAKAVATIVRNAEAQARLVDDVLDGARIIGGKLQIEPRRADLSAIIRDAVEVIRPSAAAKNLGITIDGIDAPLPVVVDPSRIEQVVGNLLSNAVKFTDKGSIHVGVEMLGRVARLSVLDTGKGIAPSFRPHVFERFRQADPSMTKRSGGLGLGLTIVRHLVELHGGSIAVESAGLDQGSKFTVTLPVQAVAHGADTSVRTDAACERVRLDGVAVLVVDDDADAREVVAAMLTSRGAKVSVAESADVARARLVEFAPRVIVSDVGMPGEDGYSLAREIRRLPPEGGGDTPMIAVTGYASASERRRAFDAGFDNHIPKPIDPEELASAIRNLARSRRH